MGQPNSGIGNQAGPLGKSDQIRSPRGTELDCRGWPQEAALRMLMNSLDPDVAEQPHDLIACGATGKVLRDWESYGATVKALKALKNNETLLVQSGKPAGVFETQQDAPRVLITNTSLEGNWPTPDKLDQLEQRGIPTPGGPDPASWTYIGTQQTLPIAFEVFDAIGRKHFGADLGGKLIVSGGMGAAGGALPLAAGMLGAAFLGIEVDGERIRRRIRAGYCDYCVNTLDEALRILKYAVRRKQAVSVGLVGNCADVIPELTSRGVLPDILTDQTSAHDLLNGYIPSGLSVEGACTLRREHPEEYVTRARDSLARHFSGMLALKKLGSVVFVFGKNLQAATRGREAAEAAPAFPDPVEAYLQPMLEEGMAPVRWVALSGEPADIRRLDDLALELFPDDAPLARWIQLARKYVRFQGLPARTYRLGQDARVLLAERVNSLAAQGLFKAPFAIAFEQAENSSGPSPRPKPEEKNESGPARNCPILDALLNAASAASWASLKCGADYSRATVVLVADGTPEAAKALQRVLKNHYALEIVRLVAAAQETSRGTTRPAELRFPKPRQA